MILSDSPNLQLPFSQITMPPKKNEPNGPTATRKRKCQEDDEIPKPKTSSIPALQIHFILWTALLVLIKPVTRIAHL